MYGSRMVPGKKNILSGGRHLNYLVKWMNIFGGGGVASNKWSK